MVETVWALDGVIETYSTTWVSRSRNITWPVAVLPEASSAVPHTNATLRKPVNGPKGPKINFSSPGRRRGIGLM